MKYLLLILSVFFICACSNLASKANSELRVGMTKDEVIAILDHPSRIYEITNTWVYYGMPDVEVRFDDEGKCKSWKASHITRPDEDFNDSSYNPQKFKN